MAAPALASLSVDLDEIDCYTAIHGLDAPEGEARRAIYARAIPRFERLFAEEGVKATFFVIGRDLETSGNDAVVRRLHEAGHEIANHSQSHFYDLTRKPRETIFEEVARGQEAIERATGERPSGFRAPGYTITDTVYDALGELGYDYDSSVFPCAPYYAAKAAALGVIALRGRRSHSILDDPRVLVAPADPYRVGRPYFRRGDGLLELPIGVTSVATGRLPYIGTTLTLGGPRLATTLTRLMRGRPLVNLEMHGIDLSDAEEDGLAFLAPHQHDLRRTAAQKETALRAAIRALRDGGAEIVRLDEAARRLGSPEQ